MRFCFIVVFSFLIGQSFAQQEPQFTMFWNNYSLFNPAATGLLDKHYASVFARNQWASMPGSPVTAGALYELRSEKLKSGIGLNVLSDKIGYESKLDIKLNYAYRVKFKDEKILSTGISFGILGNGIDFRYFNPEDPNDPMMTVTHSTEMKYKINFGALFKSPHFLIGLSATQLNIPKSYLPGMELATHYFLSCSYNRDFNDFNIKPGIFIKSDLNSSQYDFNVITTYKKRYWAGLTFRPGDAMAFMGGVDIKGKYRVGYSYDLTTSNLSGYSNGSHEVVLALMLD